MSVGTSKVLRMNLIFNKQEFKVQNLTFLNELITLLNVKIHIFISAIDSKVNYDIMRFT